MVARGSCSARMPFLFAEVFKMGWEVAASPYLHLMVQACLGGIAEVKQPQWLPGVTWLQRLQTGSIPGCGSVQALEVCKRMSELRDLHGLRSAHVPNEIRYSEDPLILEGSTASWRRHLCVVLRHWLLRLEGDASEPDWKAQGYFDSHDHSPISMFDPPQWISSTDAGSLANQILSVAEHLVSRGLSECFELKAAPSENLLEQLIPVTPIRPGTADLAEFWMWLDEVAGTDAHVRVPEHSISGIKQFDDDLGAEGRLRLREYRIRLAVKEAEIATAGGSERSNPRIETA